jgi:hypothetical protein
MCELKPSENMVIADTARHVSVQLDEICLAISPLSKCSADMSETRSFLANTPGSNRIIGAHPGIG